MISRIGNTTEFNNQKVLNEDGSVASSKSYTLQTGANSGDSLTIEIRDMRSLALGLSSDLTDPLNWVGYPVYLPDDFTGAAWYSSEIITQPNDFTVNNEVTLQVSTQESASSTLVIIDSAIRIVSEERSKLGAYQNRLEHTINNLSDYHINLTASESRISDADMAKEMMTPTKNNILSQASQAMLSHANQQPQNILQLLK